MNLQFLQSLSPAISSSTMIYEQLEQLREPQHKSTIMVIGCMGHGKSSVCKMLATQQDKRRIQAQAGPQSVTQQCALFRVDPKHELNDQETPLYVMDTPGLNSKNKVLLMLDMIQDSDSNMESLYSQQWQKLHQILSIIRKSRKYRSYEGYLQDRIMYEEALEKEMARNEFAKRQTDQAIMQIETGKISFIEYLRAQFDKKQAKKKAAISPLWVVPYTLTYLIDCLYAVPLKIVDKRYLKMRCEGSVHDQLFQRLQARNKQRKRIQLTKMVHINLDTLEITRGGSWIRAVTVEKREEDSPFFQELEYCQVGNVRVYDIGKAVYRITFQYEYPSMQEYKKLLEQLTVKIFGHL